MPNDIHSGVASAFAVPLTVTVPLLKQNDGAKRQCNAAHSIVQVAGFVIVTVYVTLEQTLVQQSLQVITTVGPHVLVQSVTHVRFKLKKLLLQQNITFTYIFELQVSSLMYMRRKKVSDLFRFK